VKIKQCFMIGVAIVMALPVNAGSRVDIEERIKPIGQVQVQGDDSTKIKVEAEEVVVVETPAALSGEDVYKKHCVVCHAAGVAGAPKFQDKASWSTRQSKGIDALLKTATSGLNAMPPKGTCMTCSNDELKAAIQFMLPN
jgi:cytochrome c5